MTTQLVVFGGLPGTGKTTVARTIATELSATFVRVDSIEVAITAAGVDLGDSPAGYAVAHAVAADQLRAGRTVVVDAVHAVADARDGWVSLARELGVPARFVRVVLADRDEHQRRVESRVADLPGHVLPTWDDVLARPEEPWTVPHLVLDNGSTIDAATRTVLAWIDRAAGLGIAERVADDTVRLGAADAGELLTLQLAAWVSEGRANGTIDIPPLQEDLADVQQQLGDPALTIWGLRDHGRLIATVRTSLIGVHTAFVGRLGVVPDLARRGLGSAMLRYAEARLPGHVTRIELVTGLHSVSNHAFYARHGYHLGEPDEAGGIVPMAKVIAAR